MVELHVSLLLCTLLVVFGSGIGKHVKQKTPEKTFVVHLSDANFKTYSTSKNLLLVDFSTKRCGFCKRFSPVFADAASRLRAQLPQVELAEVDCQTDGKATCKELGIKLVPTVYLFHNGKRENKFNRNGNVDDIVKFMSDAALKKDQPSTAARTKKIHDAVKTSAQHSEVKQKGPSVAAQPQKDHRMTSAVYTLSQENFDTFVNAKTASLVDFYAPWCPHCKDFAPVYEIAASQLYHDLPQVQLAKVNCAGSGKAVCLREKIDAYPTLWLYQNGQRIRQYEGDMTSASVVSFMSDYVQHPGVFMDQRNDKIQSKTKHAHKVCKAADHLKKDKSTNVLTFTDDNFMTEVMKEKATLVDFYAPWCPYCKALAEPFSEAADTLKEKLPEVALAIVDCTGEGKKICKDMKVSSYPTVLLFKQDEEDIVEYKENRDAGKWFQFIKSIVKFITNAMKHPSKVAADDQPAPNPSNKQCRDVDKQACADQNLATGSPVVELNDANFLSTVSREKLTLVDFYTGWCCDCKAFSPAFEDAAARLKTQLPEVEFARINCADVGDATCKSVGINWYPTVLLYKNGQRVAELKSGKTAETVMQFVQDAATHPEAMKPMNDALAGLH